MKMKKLKESTPIFCQIETKPKDTLDEIVEFLRKLMDYCLCCLSCGCYPVHPNGVHGDVLNAELNETERTVVQNLFSYLESELSKHPTINEERLRALCILTYSGSQELQRSAALCFAELSDRMVCSMTEIQVEPLIVLLRSRDLHIQKAATLAISNFVLHGPEKNRSVILNSGALRPLILLLQSDNTEVQCNACGCITTLATSEQTKQEVVKSGGVGPLLDLAQSRDLRVKRNATGAILNLTHLQSNRNELVIQGALPILALVLHTDDPDVQYYSTAALSNLAITEKHRIMMVAIGHFDVLLRLIRLLGSARDRVQCQACLALRNLASDVENQLLIVKLECLPFLHTIMKRGRGDTLAAAVACLRNLSIHRANEKEIIEHTFLTELRWIVQDALNTQAQVHAAGTLRNLAAGDQIQAIVDSGAVEALTSTLMDSHTTEDVMVEVTAALAVLADEDDTRARLLEGNPSRIIRKLAGLAVDCQNSEISYNCAGAMGQLSLSSLPQIALEENGDILVRYLTKYLASKDCSSLHIGLWTLNQLLRFKSFHNKVLQSTIPGLVNAASDASQSEAISELAEAATIKLQK